MVEAEKSLEPQDSDFDILKLCDTLAIISKQINGMNNDGGDLNL